MLTCSEDITDFLTIYLGVWDLNGAGDTPQEVVVNELSFPGTARCIGLSNEGTTGGMLVATSDAVMFLEL